MNEELLLLDEPELRVTTTRVMTTFVTYPTEYISEVRLAPVKDNKTEALGGWSFAAMGVAFSILGGAVGSAGVGSLGMLALVLALGVGAYAWLRSPAHTVFIFVNWQWVPVFVSMDKRRASKVFEVVERVVRR